MQPRLGVAESLHHMSDHLAQPRPEITRASRERSPNILVDLLGNACALLLRQHHPEVVPAGNGNDLQFQPKLGPEGVRIGIILVAEKAVERGAHALDVYRVGIDKSIDGTSKVGLKATHPAG